MTSAMILILVAVVVYLLGMLAIGFKYANNSTSEDFYLGGRKLGPIVTAMSTEASDMSAYLLMGVPGLAFFCGVAEAGWTAIGLALGTYLNWLIVAKPLRRYSLAAGNAITVSDFLSNRFHEKKKVIMAIASVFILVFFAVYAGSCFVTCGKLFSKLFGQNYQLMMVVGALFVLLYTFLGGFLAESASDFIQAIVMIIALVLVLTLGESAAGGFHAVLENARQIPGFFDFFFTATPQVDANGVQQLTAAGQPFFGDAQPYPLLTILSELAWGLGYFGMVIALDENSIIFTLVSFAWAGFGATFGPLVLFFLFRKRTTRAGAITGMIGGMVFFWKLVLKPLGGLWGIYELLPAFLFSCLLIVVVSLLTPAPSQEIQDEFEKAKTID